MADFDDLDENFEQLLDTFLSEEMGNDKQADEDQQAPAEQVEETEFVVDAEGGENQTPVEGVQTGVGTRDDLSLEGLGDNERELMKAYGNFLEAVYTVAGMSNVAVPDFDFSSSMLIPNYKPKYGKIVSEDILKGWDLLLRTHYSELKDLDMSGDDDDFLNYAENLENPNLQFAIVSYIEILIELEGCEISYESRKLRARKRRVEIEFMEEQRLKNERKQHFIDVVKSKNFPINAEQLITNYIKTANKDPDGAYKALTENPAIYAPIEVQKIKPRLFGLIKKSPKDGIRMNKKIGQFLKNLKA